MLAGKEAAAVAAPLLRWVRTWHVGEAEDPRAMPVEELAAALRGVDASADVRVCDGILAALDEAAREAGREGCVLVFGSFTTVEAALRRLQEPESWRKPRNEGSTGTGDA
jgi:dihydrofolate synthase/folylpolyglutamate synthase